MRRLFYLLLSLFCLLSALPVEAQTAWPIRTSANGRYLVDANGKPFFLMADSPWALLGVMNPTQMAEFFQDRANYNYNGIMYDILCGSYSTCGGTPSNGAILDGQKPFTVGTNEDNYTFCAGGYPTCSSINPTYWAEIDASVTAAANAGLVAMLNPLDTGLTPTISPPGSIAACDTAGDGWLAAAEAAQNGTAGMFAFGEWLGNRYKNYPNIIWYLGDDTQTINCTTGIHAPDAVLIAALMRGIETTDTNHLVTLETQFNASYATQNATVAPYITLNGAYEYAGYPEVITAYNAVVKPVINVEGHYMYLYYPMDWGASKTSGNGMTWPLATDSQNPCVPNTTPTAQVDPPCTQMNNVVFDYIERAQDWFLLTSGGTGIVEGNTYDETGGYDWGRCVGCGGVGSAKWYLWMHAYDAVQKQYLFKFLNTYPWWTLVPNTTHSGADALVTAGYGTYISIPTDASPLVNFLAQDYATSAISADHTFATVYDPYGARLTINMAIFAKAVNAQWYDPTNGVFTSLGQIPNTGTHVFTPTGKNSRGVSDMVLILQAATLGYNYPTRASHYSNGGVSRVTLAYLGIQTCGYVVPNGADSNPGFTIRPGSSSLINAAETGHHVGSLHFFRFADQELCSEGGLLASL
jgi:hypothetical protein